MAARLYQGFVKGFSDFIIRFSKLIIIGTVLLVIVCSLFIFNLHFENDITYWVDKNSSLGSLPHYVNERFGSSSPLLVAIDAQGDFFTYENLNLLKKFGDELEKIESVKNYLSIANVDDITPVADGIRVEKLIPYPLPANPAFLVTLKERILSKKNYAKKLISEDGRVALVVIKPAAHKKADVVALTVKETAEHVFNGTQLKPYFSGGPFLMNSIARIVIADFVFLVPLVSVLVLVILYLSFRTLRGVILPLITVLGSTGLTMGVMSLCGVALNVVSSAVPVILIAVGSAYGIHVLNSYYEQTLRQADKETIVRLTLQEVGLPVFMAGLTTFVGFASNVTAEVSVIKTFGIFTALGVVFAFLIALLFIPAVLLQLTVRRQRQGVSKEEYTPAAPAESLAESLQGETRPKAQSAVAPVKTNPFIQGITVFIHKHKYAVIGAFVVITAGCLLVSTRITSQVDMLGYFAPDSEPRVASRFVNDNFGGFNPLNIYLKGDIQHPDILKLILILQEHIKAHQDVSAPSSVTDVISELNQAMVGQNTIPETKAEVENLWFFVEDTEVTESMVTPDKQEGLISVFLPSLDNTLLSSLFTSLQKTISDFGKDITIVTNTPQNPYTVQLAMLMLQNLLTEQQIDITEQDARNTIAQLARELALFKPRLAHSPLADYLTGDEAELAVSPVQAAQILQEVQLRLQGTPVIEQTDIEAIVLTVVPPPQAGDIYFEEAATALARSLSLLVKEQFMKQKLALLRGQLATRFPGLSRIGAELLDYTVAPFLWATIPVPQSLLPATTGTAEVVRHTPIEAVELTGTAYLIEQIRQSIFINQITSIALALLAVLILNWFTFGSFLEGLISLVAIVFTLTVNFGIMGLFAIPLDFVTAIIGSVAIGTGIDYTIHFISRYTRELQLNGRDTLKAFQSTLATSGKAIFFNAAAVGLGFMVLFFSNVIPFRTAGLLLAITMAVSSLGAMTLLPAVLLASNVVQKHLNKNTKDRQANGLAGPPAESDVPGHDKNGREQNPVLSSH